MKSKGKKKPKKFWEAFFTRKNQFFRTKNFNVSTKTL